MGLATFLSPRKTCASVDVRHDADLVLALAEVGLVDANGVGPDKALLVPPPETLQGIVEICRHLDLPPGQSEQAGVVSVAPAVRKGLEWG